MAKQVDKILENRKKTQKVSLLAYFYSITTLEIQSKYLWSVPNL